MKFLFLAVVFLLAACCTTVISSSEKREVNRQPYPVEYSDFNFYLRLFKSEARKFKKDVNSADKLNWMVFEDKRSYIGLCKAETNYNTIYIDINWWDDSSAYDKQSLLFHEFGHCVLNRPHLDAKLPFSDNNLYPVSLMNPTVVPGEALQKFYSYYIKELFISSPSYSQVIDGLAQASEKTYTITDVNNAACQSACAAYHNGGYQYDGGWWVVNSDPLQCYCYDIQKLSDLTHKLLQIPSHPKKHEASKEDRSDYYPSYRYYNKSNDE